MKIVLRSAMTSALTFAVTLAQAQMLTLTGGPGATTFFLGYRGEFRSNATSHTASGGMRLNF